MFISDRQVIIECISILDDMEWCNEGGCQDCRWEYKVKDHGDLKGLGICLAQATREGLKVMKEYSHD